MALGRGSFMAFTDGHLRDYLNTRREKLIAEVAQEDEAYILNVSETEYVDHLTGKYSVRPLEVDFDHPRGEKSKADPSPRQTATAPRECPARVMHELTTVVYHLPFTGDPQLFCLQTSGGPIRRFEVAVSEGDIRFEVPIRAENTAAVESEAKGKMDLLRSWLSFSQAEVEEHNRQLPRIAQQAFTERKNKILAENKIIAALELPLIERDDLPKTFAVPPLQDRHEIVIPKPVVTEQGYHPDPTLDDDSHARVLEVIRDTLKVMEQHPSLCEGRDEEALRDLVLFQLAPRFKWSVTAETFNRGGKTDILLKYENSNLFVAECKMWGGQSKYLTAIDQLLSYLTWRDSKAALIAFVRNKQIAPVLQAVKEVTPDHSNWLSTEDCPDEGVFHFRLHINDDPNREVKLAVFLCQIPPGA